MPEYHKGMMLGDQHRLRRVPINVDQWRDGKKKVRIFAAE